MLLCLFNIFLSIIELLYLIIEINKELFRIIKRLIISEDRKSVENETVVITGGANGLGKELVIKFCQLKAKVIVLDVDEVNGVELVNNINNNNQGSAIFLKCDVSDYDQVRSTFDLINEKYGLYILINNAGVCNNYPLTEINHKSIIKTININLIAHLFTVKCALPKMFQNKHGHIVAIASNFGLLGRSAFTDYTASKFGIVGFMESLEDELKEFRKTYINLTVICPAAIETGLTKTIPNRFPRLLPIMQPSNAADQIVDSILKNKKFVIIPKGYSILYAILLRLPRKIRHLIVEYIGASAQPNHSLTKTE